MSRFLNNCDGSVVISCSGYHSLTLCMVHIVIIQAVIRSSDHDDTMNRLNRELQRLEDREKQRQEEEK